MAAPALIPTDGTFDTVAGLPVHPLVVHAAVVLLPLAALGLILIVLVPRWRRPFGWLTIAGLAIGAGAAFVAKESGEALAARVGLPVEHADLGDVLPLVAGALFVVGLAWFLVDRRHRATDRPGRSLAALILGVVSIVLALGTIGLTIAVGHSGAEAVWGGRISATDAGSDGAQPTPSGSADGGAAATYTLTDVEAHATPADCWTAINGTVYDVTAWIDQHPGGADRIILLCGTDGSASFNGNHAGQREPEQELARFAIGSLASPAAAGPTMTVTPAASVRTAPTVKRYTRAQVRQHSSPTDCWTDINRRVYDLTDWIGRHPGGASRIIALCGRDGTAAFTGQHGGSSRPAAILASYQIGRLAPATRA